LACLYSVSLAWNPTAVDTPIEAEPIFTMTVVDDLLVRSR
jgi:hypothetical protein